MRYCFYHGPNVSEEQLEQVLAYFDDTMVTKTPLKADAFIALGGDGTMLQAFRKFYRWRRPIYGINFGTEGFLLNPNKVQYIEEIARGETSQVTITPLKAALYDANGEFIDDDIAFNDFFFRVPMGTAHMEVAINGKIRAPLVICDGFIAATSSGSTAYSASANGPMQPLGTNCMVITAICPTKKTPFAPVVVSVNTEVVFRALNTQWRKVDFYADGKKIAGVCKAVITGSNEYVTLGFARSYNFGERVLQLQIGRNLDVDD